MCHIQENINSGIQFCCKEKNKRKHFCRLIRPLILFSINVGASCYSLFNVQEASQHRRSELNNNFFGNNNGLNTADKHISN